MQMVTGGGRCGHSECGNFSTRQGQDAGGRQFRSRIPAGTGKGLAVHVGVIDLRAHLGGEVHQKMLMCYIRRPRLPVASSQLYRVIGRPSREAQRPLRTAHISKSRQVRRCVQKVSAVLVTPLSNGEA
jgi:hypothetical protein